MSHSSLYHELANELTVGRICHTNISGREIDVNENAQTFFSEIANEFDEPPEFIHLIKENENTIGICTAVNCLNMLLSNPDFENERHTARDLTTLISHERRVPMDLPFIEGVHLFASDDTPYWVVNGNNEITGVLYANGIFHSRTMFCYLALTFDLEVTALNLCTWSVEAWTSLPEERRVKTQKYYLEKMKKIRLDDWNDRYDYAAEEFKHRLIRDMMQCTTFIDKSTMITKANLLLDQENKVIKKVFKRAERVRNACAHPLATDSGHPYRWLTNKREQYEMDPAKMSAFVKDCLNIIESIILVTPKPTDVDL